MSEYIHFEIKGAIAAITLNRPEKLNAFTDHMLEGWLDALEQCGIRDEIRVVVISGTGRAFTTGGDVEGLAAAPLKRRPL